MDFGLRATPHCGKLIGGPVICRVVIRIERQGPLGWRDHFDITTTRESDVAERGVGFRIVGIEGDGTRRVGFRNR